MNHPCRETAHQPIADLAESNWVQFRQPVMCEWSWEPEFQMSWDLYPFLHGSAQHSSAMQFSLSQALPGRNRHVETDLPADRGQTPLASPNRLETDVVTPLRQSVPRPDHWSRVWVPAFAVCQKVHSSVNLSCIFRRVTTNVAFIKRRGRQLSVCLRWSTECHQPSAG